MASGITKRLRNHRLTGPGVNPVGPNPTYFVCLCVHDERISSACQQQLIFGSGYLTFLSDKVLKTVLQIDNAINKFLTNPAQTRGSQLHPRGYPLLVSRGGLCQVKGVNQISKDCIPVRELWILTAFSMASVQIALILGRSNVACFGQI